MNVDSLDTSNSYRDKETHVLDLVKQYRELREGFPKKDVRQAMAGTVAITEGTDRWKLQYAKKFLESMDEHLKTNKVPTRETLVEILSGGRNRQPLRSTSGRSVSVLRGRLEVHHDAAFVILERLLKAMPETEGYESLNFLGEDGSIMQPGESTQGQALSEYVRGDDGGYRRVDSVVFQVADHTANAAQETEGSQSLRVTLVPLTQNLNDHHSTIQYEDDEGFKTISLYLPTNEELSYFRNKKHIAGMSSLSSFPDHLKSALRKVLSDNIKSFAGISLPESHGWLLTEMKEAQQSLKSWIDLNEM